MFQLHLSPSSPLPIPPLLHSLSSAYDPAEFEHLAVSADLKELFHHISRYTPQIVELDTKLKPFVPEYIPAIGDIDAFLKVCGCVGVHYAILVRHVLPPSLTSSSQTRCPVPIIKQSPWG